MVRTAETLWSAFRELDRERNTGGAEINIWKIKYMLQARAECSFWECQIFKYLGSVLTHTNDTIIDVEARLGACNKCYFVLQHIFNLHNLSKVAKLRINQ